MASKTSFKALFFILTTLALLTYYICISTSTSKLSDDTYENADQTNSMAGASIALPVEMHENNFYFSDDDTKYGAQSMDPSEAGQLTNVKAEAIEEKQMAEMKVMRLREKKSASISSFNGRNLLDDVPCGANYCDHGYDYCRFFGDGCFCIPDNKSCEQIF